MVAFSPLFFPFLSFWLSQPDAGVQEPDATVDDDTHDTGGAYYYVQPADDDQELLEGSQAGGLRLFRFVSQFVLAFLRQTCLTYVCTQILLLPLTRL